MEEKIRAFTKGDDKHPAEWCKAKNRYKNDSQEKQQFSYYLFVHRDLNLPILIYMRANMNAITKRAIETADPCPKSPKRKYL